VISKEEVLKIAKLARLELTETEVGKMQKDLSSILDYFDLLKKAPKLKKQKGVGDKHQKNALRFDEALPRPENLANNLIAGAPDKKDNYIKVKVIL